MKIPLFEISDVALEGDSKEVSPFELLVVTFGPGRDECRLKTCLRVLMSM